MSRFADVGGWPHVLSTLLSPADLPADIARAAMGQVLAGDATSAQIASFATALAAKGVAVSELAAMLDAAMDHVTPVVLSGEVRAAAVDVVGTGGDRSHSINVSTMAALVAAGAGVPICKHGNRASSSACGTADVLEALGLRLDLGPDGVARCVETAGFGFCMAPQFHPAFRFAGPPRRELGIPTVFNLLGPVANPARVQRQVLGVADADVATIMIETLKAHGSRHAWVVHGDGLDEITTTGTSEVLELADGTIRRFTIDPADHGIGRSSLDSLVGGDPQHNAAVVRSVLAGETGPHRDIVLLNAAAAIIVGGNATDLDSGLAAARDAIDTGAARQVLHRAIETSQEVAV